MTLGIFIPFFWFKNNTSPLDKSIALTFEYADHTPIEGLTVELYNTGPTMVGTAITDASGKAIFAGLVDETYTWEWSWQEEADFGQYKITCDKIVWEFTETLAYWTLEKTFYYDTVPQTPVEGLEVKLYASAAASFPVTKTTVNGLVTFVDLKARDDYVLEWVWGGVSAYEYVTIGFQTSTPVELTNIVGSKSGGGNKLHLAEEFLGDNPAPAIK